MLLYRGRGLCQACPRRATRRHGRSVGYQGCFSMVKGVSKLMEIVVTFTCVRNKRKSTIEAASSRSKGQVEDLLKCASRKRGSVFGVGRS